MYETLLALTRALSPTLPKAHLLANISIGSKYEIKERYMKSCKIVDDSGKDVWVSGKMIKKFFKAVK